MAKLATPKPSGNNRFVISSYHDSGGLALNKKLVDVEDLMVWAASELARKRPKNVLAFPVFDVARADREIVGKWTRPMGYPPMSPMFAAGLSRAGAARGDPPHGDALLVEAAIARMRLGPEWAWEDRELTAGLGFRLDAAGAMAAALRNAANLLIVHGRLGSRPSVHAGPPSVEPKLGPNGKPGVWRREVWAEPTFDDHHAQREVEVACSATRKGVYPSGAYGALVYAPDPQAMVNERAEYVAWRLGLIWLAGELEGGLESRAALAPRAAARPWDGERDGAAPPDLFRPGAERVYGGDEVAAMAGERACGRRRPTSGGSIYAARPAKPAPGAREA